MVSIRRAHIGGLDLNGDTISRGSVKCRWRLAWECRCGSLGYSVPGPVLSFLFVSCLPRCEQCFPDACSHCQDVLPKCMGTSSRGPALLKSWVKKIHFPRSYFCPIVLSQLCKINRLIRRRGAVGTCVPGEGTAAQKTEERGGN